MDLQRGFNFIFKDESWVVKLLIAAGLILTGIGSIAVYGWMMAVIRCASSDEDCSLPEWDDFGTYFMDGLKALGLYFVMSLPIILLSIIFMVVMIFGSVNMTEDEVALLSLISIPYSLIILLLSIPLLLLGMPAIALLANGHSLGYALDPRNSWRVLKANFGSFLITAAVYTFGSGLLNTVGFLLCCIGVYFTSAITIVLWGHYIGQSYKLAQENLGEAEAV